VNPDLSLLVAGGGPAGITAALQARELGARVTVLEAVQIGGTSLNRGPAPVRTLARAARLARDWSSWSAFGLRGPAPVPDLPAVLANSDRVARYAHDKKDVAGHVRRQGIDLVEDLGPVRFTGPHALAADDGRAWSADRVILAVGGHAARLPIPGAEHALTYEDIPSLTSLPGRVAVIGGADTGCQIASILNDFGAAVTVFGAGPVLVPAADPAVSAELGRAFAAQGMTVATGTRVEALDRADGRPDGFCKLIADRRDRTILGAHVLGEYSAETVQTVAAAMAAGMTVEQVAELQLAYPTFTEGVSMAAQKICRAIGIGGFPQVWSYLGSD
jgi:pyruvate/2-oxoglutarate dehydrogenase complex dihydrolipoamide dehydrogenase (E3) component